MSASDLRLSVVTSLYKGERYLTSFFENLVAQTIFPRLELVLVHNDPTEDELALVADFERRHPGYLNHLVVRPVEPLGASWNRGWQAARGEYIAIWNVDDRRLPDSLARQVASLDESPAPVLSYGDYVEVLDYGEEAGKRRVTPAYSRRTFSRGFPQGGAFFVFRRRLVEQVGYFDEQFRVGVDFDFSVRLALAGLEMVRNQELLGYFTNVEEGLSTRDGAHRSAVERTLVQLRYGIYDKVRPEYVAQAREYRLDEILSFGEWSRLEAYVPSYRQYLESRRYLWSLGALRNGIRTIFKKLGILRVMYKLQDRFIGREV